jgi:hypothetical protein
VKNFVKKDYSEVKALAQTVAEKARLLRRATDEFNAIKNSMMALVVHPRDKQAVNEVLWSDDMVNERAARGVWLNRKFIEVNFCEMKDTEVLNAYCCTLFRWQGAQFKKHKQSEAMVEILKGEMDRRGLTAPNPDQVRNFALRRTPLNGLGNETPIS